MDFSVWLETYRKERGFTRPELAEWFNRHDVFTKKIDKNAITNWEHGRSLPDYRTCLAIGYCAGVSDPYTTFLDVRHGYLLNEEGRRKLDEYARLLEESPRYAHAQPAKAAGTIRYYTIPVSAGYGQFLDSDDFEERERQGWEPDEADFAVRISGDSMEPRIVDKQWIFVKEQKSLEDGECGVFLYDGESYCKVWDYDGQSLAHLISVNPDYEPIPIRMPDALRVIGKVVG